MNHFVSVCRVRYLRNLGSLNVYTLNADAMGDTGADTECVQGSLGLNAAIHTSFDLQSDTKHKC